MKSCNTCKVEQSLDCFTADKRASDGKQGRCKGCCSAARRAIYHADKGMAQEKRRVEYARNKDRILASNSASRAKHRKSVLAGKKEYYDRVKRDPEWQKQQKELRESNKEIKSRYDVEYRARNSGKCLARAREWTRNNPEKRSAIMKAYSARRRANCADGDSTAAICEWERAAVKVCHWCNKKCADDYHVDHYQPLARGGRHVITNLVIACPSCNRKKNAKDPFAFAASMGRLF